MHVQFGACGVLPPLVGHVDNAVNASLRLRAHSVCTRVHAPPTHHPLRVGNRLSRAEPEIVLADAHAGLFERVALAVRLLGGGACLRADSERARTPTRAPALTMRDCSNLAAALSRRVASCSGVSGSARRVLCAGMCALEYLRNTQTRIQRAHTRVDTHATYVNMSRGTGARPSSLTLFQYLRVRAPTTSWPTHMRVIVRAVHAIFRARDARLWRNLRTHAHSERQRGTRNAVLPSTRSASDHAHRSRRWRRHRSRQR
jgi:hypothetical protein